MSDHEDSQNPSVHSYGSGTRSQTSGSQSSSSSERPATSPQKKPVDASTCAPSSSAAQVVAIHPVNFEVKLVEGVGDGGKVVPGLGFGWASSRTAPWRGRGRSGVVRPLLEGLGADRPNLRGLREWANGGGHLEPFKDVHHHERVWEEVIVVGGRGNRHVDHDKLRPIDWRRVHDRMEELEALTGHDHVPMLPGLDDSGHDVEKKPALGVCRVDGGAARGMADELGDAKLAEDKALVVEHLVLSAIVGDVVTLVGEVGDAPKLLNGKLYWRAFNKRVEHVALTLEVGVEDLNQRWVDLLPSLGDERPKAGLMGNNNTNNLTLRSILDKDKLNGTNFVDWQRNLSIVLRMDEKEYVLQKPIPPAPPANALKAVKDAYEKHVKDDN
ncbi:unnamed protein product [Cuscuta campestris]|uniref:Uncharacterized protein n=1 Tax=Cuscuta campestris TaxID=132261 RepID=A0A484NNH0_9ASTE|nr:unnamed protein product [Cuscuta campestris]